MPNYYSLRQPGVVWCVAEGHYSFEDTYNNYKSALEDPGVQDGVNVVIDVRKSLETRTAEEMREIAKLFREAPSFRGKCAMLVSHDSDVRYGLARMLGAFGDLHGMDFRVFVDEAEALDWLGGAPEPLVCNLDALSPGERDQRARLLEALRKTVAAVEELANGYAVTFAPGYPAAHVRQLIDFEERCCPFLHFEFDGTARVLTITGPPSAKGIVATIFQ